MQIKNYLVNAFCENLYLGNPACVVLLDDWLPDIILQGIAKENGTPETVFYLNKDDALNLRWFTPDIEMDLCGHATLATAFVLSSILNINKKIFNFNTKSGLIQVFVHQELFELHLPSRKPLPCSLPIEIYHSLNIKPISIYRERDYILLYSKEEDIKNIKIDRTFFDKINLNPGGVIVTAKGDQCDFVSRFFTPQATILEDPVTGSAHCSLIPFWAEKLHKQKMTAIQLSERKGILYCENFDNFVSIKGKAKYVDSFLLDI